MECCFASPCPLLHVLYPRALENNACHHSSCPTQKKCCMQTVSFPLSPPVCPILITLTTCIFSIVLSSFHLLHGVVVVYFHSIMRNFFMFLRCGHINATCVYFALLEKGKILPSRWKYQKRHICDMVPNSRTSRFWKPCNIQCNLTCLHFGHCNLGV